MEFRSFQISQGYGKLFSAVGLSATLALNLAAAGVAPPVIPVGLDAYRQWDKWPCQRIGDRAYMRSTYDRRGGNEGADASHFLYQLSDTNNVTLDVAGAGVLYFARYNHWHGSPWHYVVDGTDHVVQESSTADPDHPVADSVFIPSDPFPPPLALTWSTTKGADLSWVPISFRNSFRMDYGRTHYGTGYYIYHLYAPDANLSQPITTWNGETPPSRDVLELIARAGTDIAPTNDVTVRSGMVARLDTNQTVELPVLTHAPAEVRKLEFTIPREQAIDFGKAWLRITWDGRKAPSVDAPVALFFGAGTLYNRDDRRFLVKAFPVFIRFDDSTVTLACFFPMPFFESARVELTAPPGAAVSNIVWTVCTQPLNESVSCGRRRKTADRGPDNRQFTLAAPDFKDRERGEMGDGTFHDLRSQVGYFHATYRDHPHPEPGQDLVLLDTRETEGGGDWSGSFVGTSFIFSDRAVLSTLEGDPRFFFDDSQTPQAYGTGTEEWCGGGDYWGGANMTLPFAGHPVGASSPAAARNDEDKIESAYRFLLADLMPFGKNAVIRLEHGGTDESTEHYQTVTYWYGAPAPALVRTDELKIGDAASEAAHYYVSPQASAPYSITSRYEWGVDSYPATTDIGRRTTGTSEFTLKLNPQNLGVLLRRKLDYVFPNQRALVYVADATHGQPRKKDWALAGTWYLAGANTCVYSNPKSELGAAQHVVEASNRRFRDDEFLIARALTEGRSAIRVRIKYVPVRIPLFPGGPLTPLAWSEIRYDCYCYKMPQWQGRHRDHESQNYQGNVERSYHNVALVGNGPPQLQAPLSNLRFTSNSFSLSLPTQSGRVYRLEYKNSLTDSQWTPLPLVAGNGGLLILTDPSATNSQRYYRVRQW